MNVDLDALIEDIDFEADFIRSDKIRKQVATRAVNGLRRAGIMTLDQLLQRSRSDLQRTGTGLGVVTILSIEYVLANMGHKLPDHDRESVA